MTNVRVSEKSKGTRVSEKRKGKTPRVSMGGRRLKMQLSDNDMAIFKTRKKVPHWFNDKPGRLERALAGGYSFVKPEHATSLGQGALHGDGKDSESNVRVSLVVNKDHPVERAYLMEISEKFYKEDQVKKEAVNMKVDEALAVGGAGGAQIEHQYGAGVTYSH